MLRSHYLTGSLAVVVLCCALSKAQAQTGPAGGTGSTTPANPAMAQAGKMTPDRLANLLRKDGHQVEIRTFPNGGQIVLANVTRDGWRFLIEFEFSGDMKNVNVLCAVGNPGSSYSAPQLVELMKKSYSLNPIHFTVRPADGRLCLEDPAYSTANFADATLQQILNNFIRIVRETHPLWSGSGTVTQSPVSGTKTPDQVTPPAGNPVSPASPVNPTAATIQSLVNTTWIGSENLQDYGRLEFQFLANGQVVMIDAAGRHNGTFVQNGSNVTLTFFNGQVTYAGTINGQTFAGTASNTNNANWAFSVKC